jgi:hypothetical protein
MGAANEVAGAALTAGWCVCRCAPVCAIDVFGVGFGGLLSAWATVNSEPSTVPFAISFDPFGHLVIAEAGTNALATFALAASGTVSLLDQAATGQAATCWVTTAGLFLFAPNAGSPSESGVTSSVGERLTLVAVLSGSGRSTSG